MNKAAAVVLVGMNLALALVACPGGGTTNPPQGTLKYHVKAQGKYPQTRVCNYDIGGVSGAGVVFGSVVDGLEFDVEPTGESNKWNVTNIVNRLGESSIHKDMLPKGWSAILTEPTEWIKLIEGSGSYYGHSNQYIRLDMKVKTITSGCEVHGAYGEVYSGIPKEVNYYSPSFPLIDIAKLEEGSQTIEHVSAVEKWTFTISKR